MTKSENCDRHSDVCGSLVANHCLSNRFPQSISKGLQLFFSHLVYTVDIYTSMYFGSNSYRSK